jgi:DNA-binding XRE family transcriptional regulator
MVLQQFPERGLVPILEAFYHVPIMGAMEKSVHIPEYRTLRAELRRMRQAAGFSQRELAARLRVPHSWVAKVESGERRIDLVEFCWFATACGTDPLAAFERLLRDTRSFQAARHIREARSQ